MSLKVHRLHVYLDKFKINMEAYSTEQGERFHQEVMNFNHCDQDQYNVMNDYIWCLIREITYELKRKNNMLYF